MVVLRLVLPPAPDFYRTTNLSHMIGHRNRVKTVFYQEKDCICRLDYEVGLGNVWDTHLSTIEDREPLKFPRSCFKTLFLGLVVHFLRDSGSAFDS